MNQSTNLVPGPLPSTTQPHTLPRMACHTYPPTHPPTNLSTHPSFKCQCAIAPALWLSGQRDRPVNQACIAREPMPVMKRPAASSLERPAKRRCLTIWTDFSGIEAPLCALKRLAAPLDVSETNHQPAPNLPDHSAPHTTNRRGACSFRPGPSCAAILGAPLEAEPSSVQVLFGHDEEEPQDGSGEIG